MGLPHFRQHSILKALVQLGERVCSTPDEFMAWSQNLGHENVSTTFTDYGQAQRRSGTMTGSVLQQ
ncbi:MAG: hypothetical protein K9G59_12420 [Caulobacter sp.]|nr:hypothetical protein [Caulobacter sp.]